jgi:hypothetical protein
MERREIPDEIEVVAIRRYERKHVEAIGVDTSAQWNRGRPLIAASHGHPYVGRGSSGSWIPGCHIEEDKGATRSGRAADDVDVGAPAFPSLGIRVRLGRGELRTGPWRSHRYGALPVRRRPAEINRSVEAELHPGMVVPERARAREEDWPAPATIDAFRQPQVRIWFRSLGAWNRSVRAEDDPPSVGRNRGIEVRKRAAQVDHRWLSPAIRGPIGRVDPILLAGARLFEEIEGTAIGSEAAAEDLTGGQHARSKLLDGWRSGLAARPTDDDTRECDVT